MNISYRWLRDLVPALSLTPPQLAERLALLGAPVDEVLELGDPLRDVVIGRVTEAVQHPNADRLRLCTVDAGTGELLQVVCGAPNVRAGAFYPFAPVGSSLPGGVTLRKAKIRGVESQGMLCSARELNLGRDHDGILELHGDFRPGTSFVQSVGLEGDARLVVDVTPNRPDLLSHAGIARELAAHTATGWAFPDLPGSAPLPDLTLTHGERVAATAEVGVSIEADDLCSRYYGLVIRGVSIGPSPEWLATRLRAAGLRPISNVVDATNYVLHEMGQPLHAFDLQRLGSSVVVRRARAGEQLTTLDGVARTLDTGMLVIADAARPVAVAGVMGGAETEVHDDTRDVLLECAHFAPASVRATRRALNLSTDASYRFERGVDPDMMVAALRRAAQLIVATAGGQIDLNVAAAGPGLPPAEAIPVRTGRVSQLLGVALAGTEIERLLTPLGFTTSVLDTGTMLVTVPGHRRYDVAREEDVIEEIARHHGYDRFPDVLRPFRPSSVPDHPLYAVEDRIRDLLAARGFLETRMAAFAPESDGDVKLLLPLAATEAHLRGRLLPGLLRRVEYNWSRGARSIRLFEIGTAFSAQGRGELPAESTRLAVAFTGLRRPPHWSEPPSMFDVWDLRGVCDELAALLDIHVTERSGGDGLDPALSFSLSARDNQAVGTAGRVLPAGLDAPAWAEDVWGLELELPLAGFTPRPARYTELPQHPGVERDIALVVPERAPAGAVQAAIRQSAGPLLESAEPFDVYSGHGVPAGTRSIAYRLRYRAPDRTLTDDEVDQSINRVLARLNSEHGVSQRA